MLMYNPELHQAAYIAQEKVDGANFQLKFDYDIEADTIEMSCGKRTSMLEADTKFESFQTVIARQEIIALQEAVCEWMRETGFDEIILYAELYANSIQGRIKYGSEKRLIFYDIMIQGAYITPREFYDLMDRLDPKLAVPIAARFSCAKDAFAFEVENKMTIVGEQEEGNFWEGVVIKPWDCIPEDKNGDQILFYTKKKTKKFKDQMGVKKTKAPKAVDQELQDAWDIYISYLTDNRLKDVMGKEGQIDNPSEIGKYIKFMMVDTKEDFLKDHNELFMSLDPKNRAKVFSVAGKVVLNYY